MATYPEKRVLEQALKDLTLAYHQLQVLPELLTVALNPKGQFRVGGGVDLTSRLGWSQLGCRWKVIELWELPALHGPKRLKALTKYAAACPGLGALRKRLGD